MLDDPAGGCRLVAGRLLEAVVALRSFVVCLCCCVVWFQFFSLFCSLSVLAACRGNLWLPFVDAFGVCSDIIYFLLMKHMVQCTFDKKIILFEAFLFIYHILAAILVILPRI
jgi:hypothetical protein